MNDEIKRLQKELDTLTKHVMQQQNEFYEVNLKLFAVISFNVLVLIILALQTFFL